MPGFPRFDSIDIYRGYLICQMVIYHYLNWIYYPLKGNLAIQIPSLISYQMGIYPIFEWIFLKENIFVKINNIVSYLGTLPFMIIIGMSLVLSVEQRKERGKTGSDITKHIIKRALWLLLFNLLLAQVVLGLGTIWMIGALSIIAFNLLGGYFFLRFSKLIRGISAVLIYICTPFIRTLLHIPKIGYYANPDPGILGGILTIIVNLFNQFLPILSITLFGTILGDLLINLKRNGKLNQFIYILVPIGIIFFILAYSLDPYVNIFGLWYILQPLEDYTLFYSISLWCFLFSLLFWITEIKQKKWRIFKLFNLCGTVTLTIFFYHHFLGLNFFMYPNLPFNNNLMPFSYFEIWLGIYLIMWIYITLWARVKFKYSLEWFIQIYS